MVLNAAVQMLKEADELKVKILNFKSGTSMLQERSLWSTQQQLQKIYQKVLILDLDYALFKKVEQDLWNIGFKQQIEALQSISKDKKSSLRSEAQSMLSWVLQAAAGFYLCLLHQICTTFKLDLPFRRRASLLGWVEGWGAGAAGEALGGAAARYACQHCLVHLGDLARYRQQLKQAYSFYRHAVAVSAHSGQPYNQLALVSWRRGRALQALYWHARSQLARAPFPPAAANLRRTLAAAAAAASSCKPSLENLPVLPGVMKEETKHLPTISERLDANGYINELIRALHLIHNVEQLESAAELVKSLNSSMSALIATDSFETMTLIMMSSVIIWLVHATTEDLQLSASELSSSEREAAALASELAAGASLAALLPAYCADDLPDEQRAIVKVWLQWLVCNAAACDTNAWRQRPQYFPALAHFLNKLPIENYDSQFDVIPLPEDEELLGFLPMEKCFESLIFPTQDPPPQQHSIEISTLTLKEQPALERKIRAHRIVELGKKLADLHPEQLSYVSSEGATVFTASTAEGPELSAAVAELACAVPPEPTRASPPLLTPPKIISEHDFREKVIEKRVGILKPQGSLERAREERALATTTTEEQEEPEAIEEENKSGDKKETRKPRVNIAMAAILRKQEETSKQVKFVSPPPTPDSSVDSNESNNTKEADKQKIIQPKVLKSLANLPLGKKTGGILCLKDKSAGYPHLVNADAEPSKKPEKEDKKEQKPIQIQSFKHQNSNNRPQNTTQHNMYEANKMNFPKNFAGQAAGLSYNPNYQVTGGLNNQGIRLPVVNPKEIDVRTAAMQKQNSRQEMFQDGNKFGSYQMQSDKKNFLNDLPPRFANQYRYYQTGQENQYSDNKFRDDNFQPSNMLPQQHQNWMPPQIPENFNQPPPPWWKPDNAPSFNPNFSAPPMAMQPNYFAPQVANAIPNPYQSLASFNQSIGQGHNQSLNQNKSEMPSYLQSNVGPSLQNIVAASQNFNSSFNSFRSYAPAVNYDAAMYPQFNNIGFPVPPMKVPENPQARQGGSKDAMDMNALNFGANMLDMQQRSMGDASRNPLDQVVMGENLESSGNTYSLFSGAADSNAWSANQRNAQSLWSGPGPSPLERLLEQQKHPPAP